MTLGVFLVYPSLLSFEDGFVSEPGAGDLAGVAGQGAAGIHLSPMPRSAGGRTVLSLRPYVHMGAGTHTQALLLVQCVLY